VVKLKLEFLVTQTELTDKVVQLEQQMQKLQQQTLPGLQKELGYQQLRWSDLLTSDNYLRTERLPPQFDQDGNLIQQGGREVIDVPAAERFQLLSSVSSVIQVDAGEDATIVSESEAGVLIGIAVVVTKYTASAGTADVSLRTNLDGAGNQDFQFVFADRKWGKVIQALIKVGAAPQSGDVDGHSFYYPVGLTYGTSIVVSINSGVLTTFTGEYDLAAIVYRGKLVP